MKTTVTRDERKPLPRWPVGTMSAAWGHSRLATWKDGSGLYLVGRPGGGTYFAVALEGHQARSFSPEEFYDNFIPYYGAVSIIQQE